jgi:uncharacterized membrane protein YdjX (TVP38/TMEM64 family)
LPESFLTSVNLKSVQIKKFLLNNLPIVIAVAVLGTLVSCYFFIPPVHSWANEAYDVLTSDDEERVKEYVAQYGMLGPLAIIVALAIQMFLFVVPNILLMMIAIISYGPVWGSIISLVGIFCASSLGYFIGRKLSPATLQQFVSKKTQNKIGSFIQDYGMLAILLTRLSSFSNDALSFVAGLLGMRYRVYILSTLGGITPLVVTLAIFGRNGKIEKALVWIAIASLLLLVGYIYIDKRRKKRRQKKG